MHLWKAWDHHDIFKGSSANSKDWKDYTAWVYNDCTPVGIKRLINSYVCFAVGQYSGYCFQEPGLGAGLNEHVWTV